MYKDCNKSQMSILIIIGIILFIMMSIFITSKTNHDVANLQEPISKLNPEPVKIYVKQCIEEIIKDGMWKYGTGDIFVLEEFLNEHLLGCVVDFNEYSTDIIILAGKVESSILPTTNNEFLNIEVDMPLSIESREQSSFLEKFKVKTLIEQKVSFDLGSVIWGGPDYSSKNVESSLSVAQGGVGIEYTQTMLNTTCGEPEEMDWGTVVFFWLSGDTWYGKGIEHLTGCRPSNTKNGLHYVIKPKDPGELPLGWRTCYNSRSRDKEGKLLDAKDAAIPLKGEEVHYLVIESGPHYENRTSTAQYIMPYDNKCGVSHKDDVLTSEYTGTSLNVNVEVVGETDADGFLSMIEFNDKLYAGTYSMDGKVKVYSYNDLDGWSEEVTLPVGESVFDFEVFKGSLYAICEGNGEIFKSKDGSTFNKVFEESDHELGLSIKAYENKLYATFSDFSSANAQNYNAPGPKLFVSEDGDNFEPVDWMIDDKGGCLVYDLEVFNDKMFAPVLCDGHTRAEYYESSSGNWWGLKASPNFYRGLKPREGDSDKMYGIIRDFGVIRLVESTNGIQTTELIELLEEPTNIIIYNNDVYMLTSAPWKSTSGNVHARLLRYGVEDNSLTLIHEFDEFEARISRVFEGSLYVGTKDHSSNKAKMYKIDVEEN